MNKSQNSIFERVLKDDYQDLQSVSFCSLAVISQFDLFSTKCFTECLIGSCAHPVLTLRVNRPKAYRI